MKPLPSNRLATTSLILGLIGWLLYVLQWCFDLTLGLVLAFATAGAGAVCSSVLDVLPFLLWLTGIITGHIALAQVRRSGEGERGRAIAGLVLGYSGVFFMVILVILILALVVAGIGTAGLRHFLPQFH